MIKIINIWCDGSYTPKYPKRVGWGIVVIENNKEITSWGDYKVTELADVYRNVLGELYGSMHSILYVYENKYDKVIIHTDYQGVISWCDRSWRCKNEITEKYREFYDKMKELIQIEFVKTKGHSLDENNNKCDKLAKEAIRKSVSNE
jgi:ribonuclease HI